MCGENADLPRVDLVDAESESDGDIFDRLVVLRDDADALGDRLGRDGVISLLGLSACLETKRCGSVTRPEF